MNSGHGKLIIVGGHSRNVGKTAVISAVLRSMQPSSWTAVKISSHCHEGILDAIEEKDPASSNQGARYLIAGARKAWLICGPDEKLPSVANRIQQMLAAGENVIVESNRLVPLCTPDLVLFIVAPAIPEWKASSEICMRSAHGMVVMGEENLPQNALRLLKARKTPLPLFRFINQAEPPTDLTSWVLAKLDSGYGRENSIIVGF